MDNAGKTLFAIVILLNAHSLMACDTDQVLKDEPRGGSNAVHVETRSVPVDQISEQDFDNKLIVSVGEGRFLAEVADTPAERAQGLSGRLEMADDRAMWFDLGMQRQARFWMHNMMFPLDMIWIDESFTVVSLSANVPPPGEVVTLDGLPLYGPEIPIRYVLEINAGLAYRFGIDVGASVTVFDSQDS